MRRGECFFFSFVHSVPRNTDVMVGASASILDYQRARAILGLVELGSKSKMGPLGTILGLPKMFKGCCTAYLHTASMCVAEEQNST